MSRSEGWRGRGGTYAVVDRHQGLAPELGHRPGHHRQHIKRCPHPGAFGKADAVDLARVDRGLVQRPATGFTGWEV